LRRLHNDYVAHYHYSPSCGLASGERLNTKGALLSKAGWCFYRTARICHRLLCSSQWRPRRSALGLAWPSVRLPRFFSEFRYSVAPNGAELTVVLQCNPGQAVTQVDAMITERIGRTTDVISFGPFTLVASERLLMKEGAPVELGSRTLNILIALVSRPNDIVSKRELLAQVWPDVIVEEGSLRFHIAGLRKALSDGKDGARYITTHAGRGYCFVAPISPSTRRANDSQTDAATIVPDASLPARSTRVVGRADSILTLSVQLAASRFVTIVGSGGVGKTTVAVAVAHDLLEAFVGSVLFVDLAALLDADLAAISLRQC
jgi:DNA-binding winged helix-turn-helix (wHTH) protein